MIISLEFIQTCLNICGFFLGVLTVIYSIYLLFKDDEDNVAARDNVRSYISQGYKVYVNEVRVYTPPKDAGYLSCDVDDETKTVRMW